MKYYHIIYNSSQRTQNGAPGFGIRTYTEGTPEEYIQILDQNGCFGYESGSIAQPTPKALLENGNLILDMPITYSFVKFFAPSTKKEIYVYLRSVCVGFDYPYYVKFTAARINNFVTDAYIFEEYPGTEVSQIFYEKPAADSVSFVPQSPVPSPDNEGMKALSIGQQPLLPVEERSFASESLPSCSDVDVEMLLGYYEATRKKVPLLVRCESLVAPMLMANLIRLLPVQEGANATFMTNYQIDGVKDGYNVFFINSGYQFEYESTGQFVVLDLTQEQQMKTIESDLYRNQIKEYVQSGDKVSLDKLSTWLLSPVYSAIRQSSPEVKSVMYNYVIEPDAFTLNSLQKTGDELWTAMIAYFKKNPKAQSLLDSRLETALVAEYDSNVKARLLNLFDKLVSAGFSIEHVADKVKKEVSSQLLVSPEYLSAVLAETKGIKSISRFVEKSLFEAKNEYLDAQEMTAWWADTYKLFYPAEPLNKSQIVYRMLVDEVKTSDIETVLSSLNVSAIEICGIFATVLAKRQPDVTRTWPIVEKALTTITSNKVSVHSLPEDIAINLNSHVITPLSVTGDMTSWQDLMLLWSNFKTGSVNDVNVSRLLKIAIQFRSKDSVRIVFDKGLSCMSPNGYVDLCSAVKEFLPDIKPEVLLCKSGMCKNKVAFIGAVKNVYDVKLKVVEKLAEGNVSFLTDEEKEEVRVTVYGKKPSKPKKDKSTDSAYKPSFFGKLLGFFKFGKKKKDPEDMPK